MGIPDPRFQPPPPEKEESLELESLSMSKCPITEEEAQHLVVPDNPTTEFYTPVLQNLVKQTCDGLHTHRPRLAKEGFGGTYFMADASNSSRPVGVFKPTDEEPCAINNPRDNKLESIGEGQGGKIGTTIGGGAIREVAAYLLDHPLPGAPHNPLGIGYAGVPPTLMVRCLLHNDGVGDGKREWKIGSLQMFCENMGGCENFGPSGFSLLDVQKISVLDIRLSNTDRHFGNILRTIDGHLVPIDHGYCLPTKYGGATFDWLNWPQSKKPYTSEVLQYITSLDAEGDINLLKRSGWPIPNESARALRVSTMLLKKGAKRGLCPYNIGTVLTRKEVDNKASLIEEIILEAETEPSFMKLVSSIMDRHLDNLGGKEEKQEDLVLKLNVEREKNQVLVVQLEEERNKNQDVIKELKQVREKEEVLVLKLNRDRVKNQVLAVELEEENKKNQDVIQRLKQVREKDQKVKRNLWIWGIVTTAFVIFKAGRDASKSPKGNVF